MEELSSNFVGRQDEIEEIDSILNNGLKRIIYLEGVGGIGKTKLIQELLGKWLLMNKYYVPLARDAEENRPSLIDFYSTDNRSLDGIKEAIVKTLGDEHFLEYRQPQKDTKDIFEKCLNTLAAKRPVILAFDTFELVHNDPLASWLFTDLQVKNIFFLIGSRPPEGDKQKIEELLSNQSVGRIALSGFSYAEALNWYCKTALKEERLVSPKIKAFIQALAYKTGGNPLLIELVYDRIISETLNVKWTKDYIEKIDLEEFKKDIMEDIKKEVLNPPSSILIKGEHLKQSAYYTLLCMSYLVRRFDQPILNRIKTYINLKEGDSTDDLLPNLKRLFFVKVHKNGHLILQLHDEMARLVRTYLFSTFGDEDISGEYRREFQAAILNLYNELIEDEINGEAERRDQNKILQLQAERLYYMLEYGRTLWQEMKSLKGLEDAYKYFLELKGIDNEFLYRLLPGEMQRVIGDFSKERQKDIYVNLAEIQQRLNNLSQAELYWTEVERLSDTAREKIEILLKLHNMVWPRNVERSLNEILPRAKDFAEKEVLGLLPEVLYEIGFSYNKAQEVDEAINYYSQASQKYDELNLNDPARKATILNDWGFALSRKGEYEEALAKVGEGRVLRMALRDEAKSKVDRLIGQLEVVPADSENRKELEAQKRECEEELRRANLRLGLAYSTEGQIARYHDELITAMGRYDNALRLVRLTGHDNWIAVIQNRRGETLRRLARDQHEKGNGEKRDDLIREAHEAIGESIYLKKKYDLVLADMVERRKGRVYHDQAIWAIAEGKKDDAGKLLEQAREQFQSALDSARAGENWQEVLECEVELLFLQDDLVEQQGAAHNPEDVQDALDKYKHVLDEINVKEKIYDIKVYEYLWEIENGAYYHEIARQKGDDKDKYAQSLDHYVTGYVGMATSPGYGHARFKLHLDHLEQHIEDIADNGIAIQWCDRFLKEFRDILRGQKDKTPVEAVRQFIGWLDEHKLSRTSDGKS